MLYKINDKIVKANSVNDAIRKVNDSAVSETMTLIKNMGRGFKLVKQESGKAGDGHYTKLYFESKELTSKNKQSVMNQVTKLLRNKFKLDNDFRTYHSTKVFYHDVMFNTLTRTMIVYIRIWEKERGK